MIRTIEFRKIHEAQKNLLPSKGSQERGGDAQVNFLLMARDRPWDFCGEIRSWDEKRKKEIEPPIPSNKWSEKEFIDPPSETEKIIFDTWKDLTPAEASRPGIWYSINLTMIEKGVIESSYLAAEQGSTGRDYISDILEKKDEPDKVDQCVRRILRRLGGVLERGGRTVYENCPVAIAWWRRWYAYETKEIFQRDNIKDLSDLLRKKPIWNALIPAMTSSLTLIGDSSIRPSLISFLGSEANDLDNLTKKEMEHLIRLIGRRSEIQALGSLSPQQVFEIIRSDIFPLLKQENTVR
ncbi:hypothetical protein [Thioalkalivibrio sp. HK1]|uniref:hypothetical protein n=1 Tax=Thioalkalivibrio sp. HK1 TaxID=1469245 RepID=UPI0012DDB20F|nr:hypothetical protein [Thioalkalivibrio sp. HK1]